MANLFRSVECSVIIRSDIGALPQTKWNRNHFHEIKSDFFVC